MKVSKAFCSLVENYLIKFHNTYHPRHVPKLESLLRSNYYFFNPSRIDIKKFLLEKGTQDFIVHGAYYSGNFLKVKGSFLNLENEYFEEHFGVVPALAEYWKNDHSFEIGDLRLVPLTNFPAKGLLGSILSVPRKAIKYEKTQPADLRELALLKAATTMTKEQVTNLSLPKHFKDQLFDMCPEKRYSDKLIMHVLNPRSLYQIILQQARIQ